jgi:RimJ/RimL family protein N-acetyltransferase
MQHEAPIEILTPRLRLQPPRLADAAELNAHISDSFVELSPWLPWARELPSVADTEEFCVKAAADFVMGESLGYLGFLRDGGELIGSVGIPRLDWAVPMFEIGYWCASSLAGQGLVTEAARAIAQMALSQLGAARLEIRVDAKNARSAAVAHRLGFTEEAVLHHDSRNNQGQLCDTQLFVCFAGASLT